MAFADGHQLGGIRAGQKPAAASRRRPLLLGALLCLVVAGALAWRWYLGGVNLISTDDAYVGASLAAITPEVDGTIAQVLVGDTARVHRGDLLATLDAADANLAVEQARAVYQQAVQHVEQYQANVMGGLAEVQGKIVDVNRAKLALERRTRAGGAVSGEELSNAQTALDQAEADLAVAQQKLAAQQVLVKTDDVDGNPEVLAARAVLDLAILNLKRTEIRSPVDGVVAQLHAQLGQRVKLGAPLMSVVPIMDAYVDANFKEGEVERLRPGQPVSLTSDLYGSDVVFHGRIEGIGGGTGSALAVIPAQNATGNWIKVVQRLPVRIALNPLELENHPLSVGLSMIATVDLRAAQVASAPPAIRAAAADQAY